MNIEKSLILPDQTIITNQQEIDQILSENERKLRRKKRTPPSRCFKDIDMFTLKITRKKDDQTFGHLEVKQDGRIRESGALFSECDTTIDLTPDAGSMRAVMVFEITFNRKKSKKAKMVTVEADFDETSNPVFQELDDPENPDKLEPLVIEEVLCAISNNKWRKGVFNGSWVAKY